MCRKNHEPQLSKLEGWYRDAFGHAAILPSHHTKSEVGRWIRQFVCKERKEWENECGCDQCQVDKVLEVLS